MAKKTVRIDGAAAETLGELAVRTTRLQGGLGDGMVVVEIRAGANRAVLLPDRGLGIWKMTVGDAELGWQSPVAGPVHPRFVPLAEPSGLGWLDGFDELVARCGLVSNGAPDFEPNGRLKHPLHGRIANLPARDVQVTLDDTAGTVTVASPPAISARNGDARGRSRRARRRAAPASAMPPRTQGSRPSRT